MYLCTMYSYIYLWRLASVLHHVPALMMRWAHMMVDGDLVPLNGRPAIGSAGLVSLWWT